MIRVETTGSVWLFDEGGRYQRFPRAEKPRERAEWGATPGPLQDFTWHEHLGVTTVNRGPRGEACLAIRTKDLGPGGRDVAISGPILDGHGGAERLAAMFPWE